MRILPPTLSDWVGWGVSADDYESLSSTSESDEPVKHSYRVVPVDVWSRGGSL